MGAVSATFGRTVGRARNLLSTAFAVGGFLATVSLIFSFRLEEAEGAATSVVEIWTLAAAQGLPLLAAYLGVDVWCEERRSGRLETLLSAAVRERDLVFGKFLGVWTVLACTVVLSLLLTAGVLFCLAPATVTGLGRLSFLPALFGLFVQGSLWCALSILASVLFRHASSVFCFSVLVAVGLPRGVWAGLMSWSRSGRIAFGPMPFDAHAMDMAAGVLSIGAVAGYLVGTAVALFVVSKCVALVRLPGRGLFRFRLSTAVAVALSVLACGLSISLFSVLPFSFDVPTLNGSQQLTSRTVGILSESSGKITVTCLLPRQDLKFKSVSRLLRLLKRQSEAVGGASFALQYVDPRWDIGVMERLVSRGVTENGLIFEQGRHMVRLSFAKDGCGERACASAVRRLAAVTRRQNVYWTVGHGEFDFREYGPFGASDIARDLARDGFSNVRLDLATAVRMPGDCAFVVVAGAKEAFSRAELDRLDAYLKDGGRLLVLQGPELDSGVSPLLPTWGIRIEVAKLDGAKTVSGSDVIAESFYDHVVSAALKGSRILFERPVAFAPSVAAETRSGIDRLDYSPLVSAGSSVVAVGVERGSGAGDDLAIRPARIVAIGDAGFVLNGYLASRANANRDFVLNCAAYLSGIGNVAPSGQETGLLVSGLDRGSRFRMMIWSSVVLPGLASLFLAAVAFRRRIRS